MAMESSRSTTPPSPAAPAVNPVPLPPAPIDNQVRYDEGSMYDELPEEDIQAWHRRFQNFKRWRQDIPAKRLRELGVTSGSTATFGRGVGVGSAEWDSKDNDGSDTGTTPSTIIDTHHAHDTAGRESYTDATATTFRLPPAHTTISAAPGPPGLTISQIDPPGAVTRRLSTSLVPVQKHRPVPPLAPSPFRNLAAAHPQSNSKHSSRSPSRVPSVGESPAPGELIVPSPTPSATHAEREAYLASTIDLPLDMLRETQPASSSSEITTSRLGSLLGQSRDSLKVASERSSSSTALPSVKSNRLAAKPEGKDRHEAPRTLRRSHTVAAPQSRRKEIAVGDILPGTERGALIRRTTNQLVTNPQGGTPSTTNGASRQPVPSLARQKPQGAIPHVRQATSPQSGEVADTGHPQAHVARGTSSLLTEATTIKASRQALPLSTADTVISQVKVPNCLVTAAGSAVPTSGVKSKVTESRGLAAPSNPRLNTAMGEKASTFNTLIPTVITDSAAHSGRNRAKPQSALQPQYISFPPSVPTHEPGSPVKSSQPIPPHRQQMPLPRPALTPQASFDGLSRATSLGRRLRDPSLADLTAHFEPAMYPLPPSGTTLLSSPEIASTKPGPSGVRAPPVSPDVPASRVVGLPIAGSETQTLLRTPSTHMIDLAPAPSRPLVSSSPSPHSQTAQELTNIRHESSVPIPLSVRPTASKPLTYFHAQRKSGEVTPPSASHHRDYITISPQDHAQQLRGEEDHVSFEVPSGSRGRLRVTLKWLREGGSRSGRNEGRASISSAGSPPPPLPPKPHSLNTRLQPHASNADQPYGSHHDSSYSRSIKDDRRQHYHEQVDASSDRRHPSGQEGAPALGPLPAKREYAKRQGEPLSPQQQYRPGTFGLGPYYNPYYSGATLPAYNPPQHQIYNMQLPPLAHHQSQPHQMGWGAYRPPKDPAQGLKSRLLPDSPSRESIDPPSILSPELPSAPLPAGQIYPPGMLGMSMGGHHSIQQHQEQGRTRQQQLQEQQEEWWSRQNQRGGQRSNLWSRLFSRGQDRRRDPIDLGPDDSVTVRNWQRGVTAGRAPSLAPPLRRTVNPTVMQTPTIVQNGVSGNPIVFHPGPNPFTLGAPGDEKQSNSRYGRSRDCGRDPVRERNRPGRGGATMWDKLMWRRQVDERVYVSPNGRTNPLPAPAPTRFLNRPSRGDRDQYEQKAYGALEPRSRKLPGFGRGRGRPSQSREDVRQQRDLEKAQRRRARSARRDGRARERNDFDPRSAIVGNMIEGGHPGLSRENLGRAENRDMPRDAEGGQSGRGRPGTMIADWVGKVGRKRYPGGVPPNSSAQRRDYRPWKTRLATKQADPVRRDVNPVYINAWYSNAREASGNHRSLARPSASQPRATVVERRGTLKRQDNKANHENQAGTGRKGTSKGKVSGLGTGTLMGRLGRSLAVGFGNAVGIDSGTDRRNQKGRLS